ncbi:MAG: hypothetical protein CL678_15560 [Bdellovibrionaceae bacterium]|nr:hypothetical protein [Pseudobdellovibrionaceae bacterium]
MKKNFEQYFSPIAPSTAVVPVTVDQYLDERLLSGDSIAPDALNYVMAAALGKPLNVAPGSVQVRGVTYLSSESQQQEEDRIAVYNGSQYDMTELEEQILTLPVEDLLVSDLVWILDKTEVDPETVHKADLSEPIVVINSPNWGLTTLDGVVRLTKAVEEGHQTIKGRLVPGDWLERFPGR